jgi:hypothetical protein
MKNFLQNFVNKFKIINRRKVTIGIIFIIVISVLVMGILRTRKYSASSDEPVDVSYFVSGRLTDADKNPISGKDVVINGISGRSDADGYYFLNVDYSYPSALKADTGESANVYVIDPDDNTKRYPITNIGDIGGILLQSPCDDPTNPEDPAECLARHQYNIQQDIEIEVAE